MNISIKDLLEKEFYDVPFEKVSKYKDKSTIELLKLLEENTERTDEGTDSRYPYVEEKFKDNNLGTELLYIILQRLEIIKGYDLLQAMKQLDSEIEAKLKELETKFLNHRHPTDKTYGEKPIW